MKHRPTKTHILLAAAIMIILPGCNPGKRSVNSKSMQSKEQSTPGSGIDRFGLDFLMRGHQPGKNLVYSPYSLYTAMAMVYAGAGQSTAAEFQQVMHYPASTDDFHKTTGEVSAKLQQTKHPDMEVRIANGLWIHEYLEVESPFMTILNEHYKASSERFDFRREKQRKEARERINNWTAEQTKEKISEIIPEGTLRSNTRLILTNALYFKGQWLHTFNEKRTRKGVFYREDGTETEADYMTGTITARYLETSQMQALGLPYAESRFIFWAFLPKENLSVTRLLDAIREHTLDTLLNSSNTNPVDVQLPAFTIKNAINAKKILKEMGLEEVFGMQADLSGITGDRSLKVDEVLHKSFIDVNESGTEATAATAVTVGLKSAFPGQPPSFNANRPFLFLIRENRNNTLLFLGVLHEPENQK